jgi:hypothetical protein
MYQTAVWPVHQNHEHMTITSVSLAAKKLSGTIEGSKWKGKLVLLFVLR